MARPPTTVGGLSAPFVLDGRLREREVLDRAIRHVGRDRLTTKARRGSRAVLPVG